MSKKLDLTGQRFGRLIVKKFESTDSIGVRRLCKCDCGNYTLGRTRHLRSGDKKSCGCIYIESRKTISKTHGMSKSKLYRVYASMKERCTDIDNARYKDYGGRGIKCERKSFEEFYKDMWGTYKKGLSIDRINNNGNYCKENCRWATMKEQQNNKRNVKKIKQYTKDGIFIKTWNNANEIEKDLGFNAWYILQCCKGERKLGHGFNWIFI